MRFNSFLSIIWRRSSSTNITLEILQIQYSQVWFPEVSKTWDTPFHQISRSLNMNFHPSLFVYIKNSRNCEIRPIFSCSLFIVNEGMYHFSLRVRTLGGIILSLNSGMYDYNYVTRWSKSLFAVSVTFRVTPWSVIVTYTPPSDM